MTKPIVREDITRLLKLIRGDRSVTVSLKDGLSSLERGQLNDIMRDVENYSNQKTIKALNRLQTKVEKTLDGEGKYLAVILKEFQNEIEKTQYE